MMTATTSGTTASEVSLGRVIRSEWIKLWSLRSTVVLLLSGVVVVTGPGVITAAAIAESMAIGTWDPGGDPFSPHGPIAGTLYGVQFAQLLVGLLGVLLVSSEYSSGMIKATVGAVPSRLPVLWSKVVVFGAVAFGSMLVATMAAFLIGRMSFADAGIDLALLSGTADSPAAFRSVVLAAPLYLCGVGIIAIALATIVRNTAASVAILYVSMFLLAPILGLLVPDSIGDSLLKYLPSAAGQAFMSVDQRPELLGAWPGFLVFCGYIAVLVGIAAVVLRRRDV